MDNSVGFDDKCQRVVGSLLKRLGLDDKRYGVDICKFKFLVDPSFAMVWRRFHGLVYIILLKMIMTQLLVAGFSSSISRLHGGTHLPPHNGQC